jgi:glucosamine--fructose-6-phosphate aminotransferase (isomerizing)
VRTVLDDSRAPALAADLLDYDAYFFVGRGHAYPVALEGALKFKEVTYEHAEGFAAGELKHGPLALVTEATPVFAVVTGDDARARKTLGNVKEVQARGAPVVAVSDGLTEVDRYADEVLAVPEAHERVRPVLANVQLQLVAYHVAARLGRSIDKPRNLAKSVTVE